MKTFINFPSALMISLMALSTASEAGSFVFAREGNEGIITHPNGYTGTGGALNIKVCIRPSSSNTANLEQATQNTIAIWNEQKVSSSNLLNNLPEFGSVDVESVLTHELGHCIGLAHPNLAVGGVSNSNRNYTSTTNGADDIYNLGIGADNVRGSTDDNRGDDGNLHWFRTSNNNPFSIASIVDASTYTFDDNNLPQVHSSVANGDRLVSALFSAPNTEAVMQQGTFNNEAQRTLAHDDVATLQFARSGLDTIAGNADDYTINLFYGGISSDTDCKINLGFDNNETGFAVCRIGVTFLQSPHLSITSAEIFLNDGTDWHYNTDKPCSESTAVTANEWKMISLPCQVGISTPATVQGQFGDDLNVAGYSTTWELWRFDSTTGSYVALSLTDELEEGVGYWFITLDSGITVDIEGQYNTNLDVPIVGGGTAGVWNMIGSPFRLSVPWSTATVVKADGNLLDLAAADPDVGGGSNNACDISPIDASCAMADTAFKYNGTTYDTITPSAGDLDPFDAAWVFVQQQNLALRLPMSSAERTTP